MNKGVFVSSKNKWMMITVSEALDLIQQNVQSLKLKKVPLEDATGFVLGEDIYSPIHQPPFDSSAMDGYALAHSGLSENPLKYRVVGEVKAGDDISGTSIHSGECVRIFTGAAVPKFSEKVVIQEVITKQEDCIVIPENIRSGANIRLAGEQFKKGGVILEKNHLLRPASIGLLASSGFSEIAVYSKPKISVIVTGNELVKPGNKLITGQIYESNSYMIHSAIAAMGINANAVMFQKDDLDSTVQAIEKALNDSDMIVISGGISVGEYDFVGKALEVLGVQTVFYKVKQKPGKPIFYGKLKGKEIFALPGNPGSALNCFYLYVVPAIRKMMGIESIFLNVRHYSLKHDFKGNTSGKTIFLKALAEGGELEILPAQSSFMLKSFALANALAILPIGAVDYERGDQMEAYLLPF